ncbi:hypothetical protein SAMN05216268_13447 [Streptomyces yunnanensis]|uniref:Phage integrase family protein n=1 Tax=Streptomyces yunnanensis TaxID=156453 RepID=A0A9X8R076_9ACTN|nr:hypothetical protein [Streptomyces yunnanensis]SHN31680.1 hypothetical protein SAMN05216268_13447 [Streptomyces yunnanensis]
MTGEGAHRKLAEAHSGVRRGGGYGNSAARGVGEGAADSRRPRPRPLDDNGQPRALLDQHTALAGPGTGWDLHEWRHSSLTHLGEQGASLLMLMAKSRHKKAENVRRCFKPSAEAIAEVTSLLAPGDARR